MKYSTDFKIQPIVDIKSNRVCGGEILIDLVEEILLRKYWKNDNDPFLNLEVTKSFC